MNYYQFLRERRFGSSAVVADAADGTAGKVDMEAHDRRHHPHGFDPEHDTCKFREDLAKADKADVLSPDEGKGGAKWDAKDRADAEETAKVLKRVLGGVEVEFADKAYDGGGDMRNGIGGIFTGTQADYANESRNGGTGDGPSLQKVGSGFGAQVYGWGLYGTDVKDTAGLYGNCLYEQTFFTNRKLGDTSHLLEAYGLVSSENAGRIADGLMKEGIEKESPIAKALTKEYIQTQQGTTVYEALRKNYFGGDAKATSEFLARNDIDGMYHQVDSMGKDVNVGGAGKAVGRNYISFRDDNIRVDHKWVDGEQRYFKNSQGKVVGEYDRATGKITLYPGAKVKDVVHEYAHGLWQYAEQEAKAGRGALLGKMREIAFSAPQGVKDAVRANYGSEGADVMLEECFAHELARRSDTAFANAIETAEGRPWYRRAWKTIKDVWKGFADKAGFNKADTKGIEDMSPADAAEHILSQLAKGRRFGDVRHDGGDGKRKAIIGKQGAAALGIGRHDEAEKMERDGASREDIWRKTGWWKGKDGKWRVEVPDVKLPFETLPSVAESKKAHRFLMQNLDKYNVNTIRELEQKAPEAYSQYAEMKRKIEDMEKREAEDQFTVRDFVKGTGLDKAYPDLMKIPVRFKLQGSDFWLRTHTNGYFDGEKMVINRLTEPERIRSHIAHELQHAIQDSEGFAKGADGNFGDFSEYIRSAGEVESRNVQKRLEMTPEDRSATPPWETEDVPKDEQIVRN